MYQTKEYNNFCSVFVLCFAKCEELDFHYFGSLWQKFDKKTERDSGRQIENKLTTSTAAHRGISVKLRNPDE